MLPDVWSLADGLADALAELSKAAEKVGATPAKGSRRVTADA